MSKSTYPLKLPTSVKTAAARLAKADGVSLNQFIAAAVAETVASWRPLASCWSGALVTRAQRTCSSTCARLAESGRRNRTVNSGQHKPGSCYPLLARRLSWVGRAPNTIAPLLCAGAKGGELRAADE